MIDRTTIDTIIDKINIVDVISEKVNLNQKFKGLCPFHDETNPSFSVHVADQYFHCFGCGVGGDVIRFLELIDGIPFMEAARKLANRAGIRFEDFKEEDLAAIHKERTKVKILGEAAKFYHSCLNEETRDYLKSRGLSEDTVSHFRIGYATGGLRAHLERIGYSLDLLKETRLVKENGRDFFYEKIILPYYHKGQVTHIRARSHPSEKEKCYFQLPGYEIRLFNEDDVHGADQIIIAEGEFDTMILKQLGYNVVGIPGANTFQEGWVCKLEKCKSVFIALDGDNGGIEGAVRIASFLGEKARIVSLPDGQDITDWYLSEAQRDFEPLLNQAKTRLERRIEEIKGMPGNRQREELKTLFRELKKLDAIDIAHYKDQICRPFRIGKREFDKALKEAEPESKTGITETLTAQPATKKEVTQGEQDEALSLLKSSNLLQLFLDDIETLHCVGEEENKTVLFLALTSRLLQDPINVIFKGESSAGKSYTLSNVLKFFPEEDVLEFTAMSPKALYHRKDDIANKALVIHERAGAEDTDYSIRIMQSEKKLIFSSPIKNEVTGRYETEDVVVNGPVSYIETTTKTHLHPENETRCFEIFPDESEQQTERIFKAQNLKYKGLAFDHSEITRKWKNAQRLLKPHRVHIPYIDEIEFPTVKLRARRDRLRFLTLIEASAILHQHQRKHKTENGIDYVLADLEDYNIAYHLGQLLIFHSMQGLSPRLIQVVDAAWSVATEKGEQSSEAATAVDITRKEVEHKSGFDRKTIIKYLKAAEKEGYLEIDTQGQGKAWKIRVVKPASAKPKLLLSPEELLERYEQKCKLVDRPQPIQTETGKVNQLFLQD